MELEFDEWIFWIELVRNDSYNLLARLWLPDKIGLFVGRALI
jgi:hypothetical protein